MICMKRAILVLAGAGLLACSTPAPPPGSTLPPATAAAANLSIPAACPARAGTDMHSLLPEPHFLPAAPVGATLVLPARLLDNSPAYPAASRSCREEGKVAITYCVAADGSVENVQVVVSSGYARLDNAMLAWAATDRHRPGTVNGQPRRYCGLTLERRFEIDAEASERAQLSPGAAAVAFRL
jgi:protein TonB